MQALHEALRHGVCHFRAGGGEHVEQVEPVSGAGTLPHSACAFKPLRVHARALPPPPFMPGSPVDSQAYFSSLNVCGISQGTASVTVGVSSPSCIRRNRAAVLNYALVVLGCYPSVNPSIYWTTQLSGPPTIFMAFSYKQCYF